MTVDVCQITCDALPTHKCVGFFEGAPPNRHTRSILSLVEDSNGIGSLRVTCKLLREVRTEVTRALCYIPRGAPQTQLQGTDGNLGSSLILEVGISYFSRVLSVSHKLPISFWIGSKLWFLSQSQSPLCYLDGEAL